MTTKIPVELSSTPGIVDGSNATAITIDSSERVGIGTTSPSTLLHLGGTAPGDSIIRQDSTSSGTNWEIGERAAGKWQIFEDDADSIVATFMSSGKVGIGETTPLGKLHIKEDDSGVSSVNSNFDQLVLEDDSHSGMTILSGTSGDGAIYFGDSGSNDIGQIKYKHSTNQLDLTTSGSTRLTIDSSGNVGIGETSPAAPLHVEHSSATAYDGTAEITESLIVSNKAGTDNSGVNNVASIGLHVADGATSQGFINYVRSANNQGYFTLSQRTASSTYEEQFTLDREGQAFIKGTSPYMQIRDTTAGGGAGNGGQVIMSGHHAGSSDGFREFAKIVGVKANSTGGDTHGYLGFYSNQGSASSTEGARLTEDGHFHIGCTATPSASVQGSSIQDYQMYSGVASTSTRKHKLFFNGNGEVGSISTSSSATAFNTSSDARLKDITGSARGLEVINALNPVAYNWKADGKADEGLIAQEVLEIVPNAVSGSEEEYYQMDYSKLVTPLVKAIQEQQEQIEQLKVEIQTLKGE